MRTTKRLLALCAVAATLVAAIDIPVRRRARLSPTRLIRIIVPFTPGGSNDVVAREIATGLQARLKQTAVVENKPGGGGTIAYSFVAKSPPDGHTADDRAGLVHHGPASVAEPGLPSGDRFRADQPGCRRAVRHGGAVDAAGEAVQEFIALAKKSPDKLTFGSVGRRHAAASRRRAVQDARQGRPDPRAVPRRDRRDPRSAGRPHRHVHRRHQFAAAADRGGQAARARREPAASASPRCRTCRPWRRPACPASRSAPASAWWRRPARRPTSSRRSTARSCEIIADAGLPPAHGDDRRRCGRHDAGRPMRRFLQRRLREVGQGGQGGRDEPQLCCTTRRQQLYAGGGSKSIRPELGGALPRGCGNHRHRRFTRHNGHGIGNLAEPPRPPWTRVWIGAALSRRPVDFRARQADVLEIAVVHDVQARHGSPSLLLCGIAAPTTDQ